MEYIRKSTDELAVGDVVRTHGMRVALKVEPRTYPDHQTGLTVYAFDGRILNVEEALAEHGIPARVHLRRPLDDTG